MSRNTCKCCGIKVSKTSKNYCQSCYLHFYNPIFNPIIKEKCVHKKENHPMWKGGKPRCIDCGKRVSRYDAIRCRQCSNLYIFYIDGRSFEEYPKEYTKYLRQKIRKRDNYTCQNCNMTEEEHLIVYGQVLSIHHIDNNKNNCSENNLITLCRPCNNRAKFNRNYWEQLYKEKMKCLEIHGQ